MILLSIKPEHANKIFNGEKTIELRRVCPKLSEGDLVIVYVSSPVKAIQGAFEVGEILIGSPLGLWRKIKNKTGLSWTQFNSYFSNSEIAYGLEIKKTWTYASPIKLNLLRKVWHNFTPPQSFRYLTDSERDSVSLFD